MLHGMTFGRDVYQAPCLPLLGASPGQLDSVWTKCPNGLYRTATNYRVDGNDFGLNFV